MSLKDNVSHCSVESNWSKILHGIPQGSVLGPLLFLLHFNDLSAAMEELVMTILFTDDTSLIVTDKSKDGLDIKLSVNIKIVDSWFKSNLLSINVLKTCCMQFITRNTTLIKSSISCKNNEIGEVCHLKFPGLEIDNTLSWNLHIDIVNKLTRVSFMIRSVKQYMSLSSLIMIYYSLFHSTLSYGIIFWGQASNSKRIFLLQESFTNNDRT
jgi:hypothetical protein